MLNPSGLFETTPLPTDAVELGRFVGAWGVKGWSHIQLHSTDSSALFNSMVWFLLPPEVRFGRAFSVFIGSVRAQVADIKVHAHGAVARLEGVNDRESAECLKGVRIYVPRSTFTPTQEGEYYWVDLIGLDVFNREGLRLGSVSDLLSTGPTSVLVIVYTDMRDGAEREVTRMIPFVAAYIDDVDLQTRRITVDWGLDD